MEALIKELFGRENDMYIIAIMVLWTWGLTPAWVNILATIICGLKVVCDVVNAWLDK